jgi:hypothetical protein
MDRTNFLSSLSFLLPLSSSETEGGVVPALLRELEADVRCDEDRLIDSDDNYFVSIEPVVTVAPSETNNTARNTDNHENENDDDGDDDDATVDPSNITEGCASSRTSLGPAYFKVKSATEDESQGISDPAMCPFQMNVYKARLSLADANLTTPIRDQKGRNITLFGGILDNGDEESGGNALKTTAAKPTNEAVVIICVDGQTYQLDMNSIEAVRLEEGNEDGLPQSLILEFVSCRMRIFSSSARTFTSVLKKTRDALHHLQDDSCICPFPIAGHWTLPGSTGERKTEESALKQLEQCLGSYLSSWDNVASLERVLSSPVAARSNTASNDALQHYVTNTLRKIPETAAASFAIEDDLSLALEHCNNRLSEQQDGLSERLDAFWKTTSGQGHKPSKKRSRKESPCNRRNDDVQVDQRIQNACVEQTNTFFESHKEALATKYGFCILPARG